MGVGQFEWVEYFSPVTISGLTFHSGGVLIIRAEPIPVFPWAGWALINYDSLAPLTVGMNKLTLAFGAGFSSWLDPVYSEFLATITLDNGSVFTFTAPADPNYTFFGIVTTQPFTSLTFSDGGLIGIGFHEEILDNITVVTIPRSDFVASRPAVTACCSTSSSFT